MGKKAGIEIHSLLEAGNFFLGTSLELYIFQPLKIWYHFLVRNSERAYSVEGKRG
jgi:hypothetical protein